MLKRKKKREQKHRVIGKCDLPLKVEQKEPGRSPGRSAWLVWHLTLSSLYTELITVMQRAQYYSNKAKEREINGDRRRRNVKQDRKRSMTTLPSQKKTNKKTNSV